MFHALTNAHAAITALRPIVLVLKKRSPRLADQLERSATGIALQVAEGAERVGRDQLHLYRTAAVSCREAHNAIKAAVGWGYVTDDEIAAAEASVSDVLIHTTPATRTPATRTPATVVTKDRPRLIAAAGYSGHDALFIGV